VVNYPAMLGHLPQALVRNKIFFLNVTAFGQLVDNPKTTDIFEFYLEAIFD
jgi:hypothetical protein